jgi:ApbE superfamily uncharacterized protein (UPF0280 family)
MEVRRRVINGKKEVLLRTDVAEFSIMAEAVDQFRSTIVSLLRDNPKHFKDPAFAKQLLALSTLMIREMEDPNEQKPTRR